MAAAEPVPVVAEPEVPVAAADELGEPSTSPPLVAWVMDSLVEVTVAMVVLLPSADLVDESALVEEGLDEVVPPTLSSGVVRTLMLWYEPSEPLAHL